MTTTSPHPPGFSPDLRESPAPASNKILTVSNILSICRILLAIPFALVMLSDMPAARYWGVVIMAVAMLTDKLDGDLARKYGETTELGTILDPLADKIGVAVVALVLLSLGIIPVWFVFAMIVRDILIFGGGMYVKAKRNIVLPSNLTGKWAVGVTSATLLAALLDVPATLIDIMIGVCVIMLAASMYLYTKRFLEILNTAS